MQGLTRVIVINAVPMFFFISGFLFFLKKDTYTSKWKKRFHSLVIPYIIWCAIGFLIPFFFQQIMGLGHLFKGGEGHLKPISEFEGWDYLKICALAVTYSYVMYCALRKIFPKLLNIITGSR